MILSAFLHPAPQAESARGASGRPTFDDKRLTLMRERWAGQPDP